MRFRRAGGPFVGSPGHEPFNRMRRIAFHLVSAVVLLAGPALAEGPADNQFAFAVRLMQTGDNALAEEAFAEFISKFATDDRVGDAYYYRAVLARKRGDLTAASSHLQAVQNPRHVSNAALRLLRGQVRLELNKPAEALADFEQIKAEELKDAASLGAWHYLMGSAYRLSGNPAAAVERFTAASVADPSIRGLCMLERGKANIELKQLEPALESFNLAIAAEPAPEIASEALSFSGNVAYQLQLYDQSAAAYAAIVQKHQTRPEFQPALLGVMRAHYAAGRYEQAIQQYEATRSLIAQHQKAEAYYLLGASCVQLKKYKEGEAAFLEFYRTTNGDHPLVQEVAYQLAVCFYQTDVEGFESWMKEMEPALPSMSRRSDLEYMRAQAAIKRSKPNEAIAHLTSIVERGDNPYIARALLQRAALHEQQNNAPQAAADYTLYSERFGQTASASDAILRAIDLAFRGEQFDKVVSLCGQWLSRKENNPEVLASVKIKLAVAQLKLNQRAESVATLESLIASNPPPPAMALARYYHGVILASEPTTRDAAIRSLASAAQGPLPDEQKVDAMMVIARLHRINGQNQRSLETYEQLRALRPPQEFDPVTAAWVGQGLCSIGNHESALLWLEPVMASDDAPEAPRAQALYYGGESLRNLGRHEQAIAAYKKLLASTRLLADEARLGLAHSLAAVQRPEEAIAEYDKLAGAESSPVAAASLVYGGEQHLKKALLVSQTQPEAASAHRHEARKRFSRATLLYDVPQLDVLIGRAVIELGRIASDEKRTDEARKYFQSLQGRNPRSAWQEVAQAEAAILDGQSGEGVTLLRRIMRESSEPGVRTWVEQRLRALGEQP